MSDPAGKKPVAIPVPSKDPKKSEEAADGGGGAGGEEDVPTMNGSSGEEAKPGAKQGGKKGGKGGKDVVEPEELSEEDKALKEGLELAVARVEDPEPGIGECA